MEDAWAKSRTLDFLDFCCWSDFQPSGWISIQLPWLDFHLCCVIYITKQKSSQLVLELQRSNDSGECSKEFFRSPRSTEMDPIPFLPLVSKQLVNLLQGAGLNFVTGNRNLGAHQRHFGLLANQPIGHQTKIVYLLAVAPGHKACNKFVN